MEGKDIWGLIFTLFNKAVSGVTEALGEIQNTSGRARLIPDVFPFNPDL